MSKHLYSNHFCLFSYAMLMRSLRYLHCRAAGIVLISSVRLDSQRGIPSVKSVRLVLHSELKVHDLLHLDENNKGRKMNTHKVHKSIFSYQYYLVATLSTFDKLFTSNGLLFVEHVSMKTLYKSKNNNNTD